METKRRIEKITNYSYFGVVFRTGNMFIGNVAKSKKTQGIIRIRNIRLY